MLPLMPLDPRPSTQPMQGRSLAEIRALMILLAKPIKFVAGLPAKMLLRPLQFQLRTLLLIVMYAAVFVSLIARAQIESARQLAIATELVEQHGIRFDVAKKYCVEGTADCNTVENAWWQELLGAVHGERVFDVEIRRELTERAYDLLAQLPEVKRIRILCVNRIDLARLPPAERLTFYECWGIESNQLKYLNRYGQVNFYDSGISYENFAALQRWRPGCFYWADW